MDLIRLFQQVFGIKKGDRLLIIYDIPKLVDDANWEFRRKLAKKWFKELNKVYKMSIAHYDATYANNSDLPDYCFKDDKKILFQDIFSNTDIVIALTEFSATAPLKKYTAKYNLRTASMPGFNKKMMAALDIDMKAMAKKVEKVARLIDASDYAEVTFKVSDKEHKLFLDLRNKKPIKDDGNCKNKGTVINLPSGEAFISPFEGKNSKTNGILPIQNKGDVVLYEIKQNNIVSCNHPGDLLMQKIKKDPAVGNIAEFAFGVLGLFGIKACGRILLDEKLGMHIALGRSDHFGGITSPKSFRKKENVWHQDFVYIKEMQPKISIKEAKLLGKKEAIVIKEDKYIIF